MSRVFSFRDLRLIPQLSHLTEEEMLRIENDDAINSALSQLGFNISEGVIYEPSVHRDLQGTVAIGYRAVGTLNNDQTYLKSSLCPVIERLIAAARKDGSLAQELCRMMGHSISLDDDNAEETMDAIEDDYEEPTFSEVSQLLQDMVKLRDSIRGNPYNETGSLKKPEEYKQ